MNCKEANQKSIVGFLESQGISPAITTVSGKYWYCSPFRAEKTPSFSVLLLKNIWYDHGAGIGGSLIDLVC